jgi:hypothetical protein
MGGMHILHLYYDQLNKLNDFGFYLNTLPALGQYTLDERSLFNRLTIHLSCTNHARVC